MMERKIEKKKKGEREMDVYFVIFFVKFFHIHMVTLSLTRLHAIRSQTLVGQESYLCVHCVFTVCKRELMYRKYGLG
jgi:hypothetical protein